MRGLASLPASDSAGTSLFFLVIAWMLGGYVGATAVAVMLDGTRGPGLRQAAIRLGLLAGYAILSGLLGALLIGPVMGVVSDQAALYGVLAEAEALGLELIEVRRLPPRDQPRELSS